MREGGDLSQRTRVRVPMPGFYVAYNGEGGMDSSDCTFGNGFLTVRVVFVDINFDRLGNTEKENALAGYSHFYREVRAKFAECGDRDIAFGHARGKCIENGYLTGIVDREDFEMMYKPLVNHDEMLREGGIEIGMLRKLAGMIHRKLLKGKTRDEIIFELELEGDEIEVPDNFDEYRGLA